MCLDRLNQLHIVLGQQGNRPPSTPGTVDMDQACTGEKEIVANVSGFMGQTKTGRNTKHARNGSAMQYVVYDFVSIRTVQYDRLDGCSRPGCAGYQS